MRKKRKVLGDELSGVTVDGVEIRDAMLDHRADKVTKDEFRVGDETKKNIYRSPRVRYEAEPEKNSRTRRFSQAQKNKYAYEKGEVMAVKGESKSELTNAVLSMLLSGGSLTPPQMSKIGLEKYGIKKESFHYSALMTKIYRSDLGFFISRDKRTGGQANCHTLREDATHLSLSEACSLYDSRGDLTLLNIAEMVGKIKKVDLTKDKRKRGYHHTYPIPQKGKAKIAPKPRSGSRVVNQADLIPEAGSVPEIAAPANPKRKPVKSKEGTIASMAREIKEIKLALAKEHDLRVEAEAKYSRLVNVTSESSAMSESSAITSVIKSLVNAVKSPDGINFNFNFTHRVILGEEGSED